MKSLIAIAVIALSATAAQATECNVETAKKYVAGIEVVAAEVSSNIDMGDKVNGKTLAKSDIKVISADSAYIVTVTNEKETYYSAGNYSKYIVTLKKVGRACFPASIVLVGNTKVSD